MASIVALPQVQQMRRLRPRPSLRTLRAVRAAVKRVLRTRGVKAEDLAPLTAAIIEQAEALYADCPIAA